MKGAEEAVKSARLMVEATMSGGPLGLSAHLKEEN